MALVRWNRKKLLEWCALALRDRQLTLECESDAVAKRLRTALYAHRPAEAKELVISISGNIVTIAAPYMPEVFPHG